MNTPNEVLMDQAKMVLKGKWGLGVKVTIVSMLVSFLVSMIPMVGSIASFLIAGAMTLGITSYWLAFSRKEYLSVDRIFRGFDHFWKAFVTYLLMNIYILLWTLLLIIPGIMAALSYSQTFFILSEDSTIGSDEAITKSKKMMDGHKWKLFRLWLRFLGWGLLCILTLGIGFLWLVPYSYVSLAKFYEDIKVKSDTGTTEVPEIVAVPLAN